MHYNSLNNYLRKKYGCKIYKISLNAGLSCPNRDGSISYGGCIFCSEGGSGDFAPDSTLSISEQIIESKKRISSKNKDGKYIAYFQAFTNTYGPIDYLRKIYYEAIADDDIVSLSIATRPDCLDNEVIDLLSEINKIKPVWIELGLQTQNSNTAKYINRGYDLSCFENAVRKLNSIGVDIIVHIIIGLPGESKTDIYNTVKYVSTQNIHGIKLQLLHVLKNTALEQIYASGVFSTITLEEYTEIVAHCIELTRPDIIIHRITGDGPKKLLIAPLWSSDKKRVLNHINNYFVQNNITQGKLYEA